MRALLLALVIACGGDSRSSEPIADKSPEIAIGEGTQAELAVVRKQLVDRLEKHHDRPDLIAAIAEVDGLSALLYGFPVADERVFAPPGTAGRTPGYRSWVIGKVAFELTRVKTAEQAKELADLLDELGKTHPADPWRRWLAGRVALVRGDRAAAQPAFANTDHPIAKIEYALFLDEESRAEEGVKLIALLDHPLARVTKAILHAELGNVSAAVAELELVKGDGPRLVVYSLLANAFIGLANERYDLTAEALGKLGRTRVLPAECALWERISWAHLQLGRDVDKTNDHKIASIARRRCAALGRAVGRNDLLDVVDATLQLGLGAPDRAYQQTRMPRALSARVLGAYAALELGRPDLAKVEVDDSLKDEKRSRTAPAWRSVQLLRLVVRIRTATGKPRTDALAELAALADGAKDQRARQLLGVAYHAIGDLTAAKRELRRVVEETSAERPDPFAYRTHQLLAEIAIATDDLVTANPEIERAIAIHPGNSLSRVIQARVHLRRADPASALEAMAPARKLGELIPAGKLVVAEALASLKDATPDQRAQARALVVEVKGKLPPDEVGRVAAIIDPNLPGELGLPVGKPRKQGT